MMSCHIDIQLKETTLHKVNVYLQYVFTILKQLYLFISRG